MQTHHHQQQQHQQQQMMIQQEQENMLSTIFEASCEEATPMTSLVDVHQQRIQVSPPPVLENNYMNDSEDEEEEEEETDHPIAPSFATIDEIPVSTIFSKNESKKNFQKLNKISSIYYPILDLKYSEYILQKLQTEVNNQS